MNLRALAAADPDTPERQRNCGVVPIGSQVEIRIKNGSAYYCGLETCGNVWLCPVCSAKIHHRRAAELRDALTTWEANGHATSLATITVPHNLDDPLSKLVDAQRAAWKRVTADAAWQRLKHRLGITGHVIALEFTWGDENGWHPHYHVLLVHDQHLDASAIAALHAHIHSRLAASCRDHGLRQPDQLHAARIDPNVSATAAGAYIAKGGNWTPAEEMTRGDLKTGRTGSRTPFQILADYYQTGDTHNRDMRTVDQGFEVFLERLTPLPREREAAAKHRQSVEAALKSSAIPAATRNPRPNGAADCLLPITRYLAGEARSGSARERPAG